MSLSSLIRGKSEPARFATATPATVATLEGDKVRTVATVATVNVANPTETISATTSRWWLLHYPDREPVEVASFPPATHAEILERHPEAIAAEPIQLQRNRQDQITACSTCSHVTKRGACGEPVAAGLADMVGVIRHSGNQGAPCPAWLATIPPDLEDMIVRAGVYWEYSPEDYDLIRETARRDPDGLRLALRDDPAFQPTQGRVTP